MLLVSACSNSAPEPVRPSGDGLCAGLLTPAKRHAAALAESPHDPSVTTGDQLIAGLIAGCGYDTGGEE